MAARPLPSYLMYKDAAKEWRWKYEAKNGRIIAVSSESYHNKADCRHSVDLIRGSGNDPIWAENE